MKRLRVKDIVVALFSIGAVATIVLSRQEMQTMLKDRQDLEQRHSAALRSAEGRRLSEEKKVDDLMSKLSDLEAKVAKTTQDLDLANMNVKSCRIQVSDLEKATADTNEMKHVIDTLTEERTGLQQEASDCEAQRLFQENANALCNADLEKAHSKLDDCDSVKSMLDEYKVQTTALTAERDMAQLRETQATDALEKARLLITQQQQLAPPSPPPNEEEPTTTEATTEEEDFNIVAAKEDFNIVAAEHLTADAHADAIENLAKAAAQEEEETPEEVQGGPDDVRSSDPDDDDDDDVSNPDNKDDVTTHRLDDDKHRLDDEKPRPPDDPEQGTA